MPPPDTSGEDASHEEQAGQHPDTQHPGTGAWWENRELQRARLLSQIELIQRELPGVGVYPTLDQGSDIEYLYREGVILVRDEDVQRVRQVVGGPPAPADQSSDDFVVDAMISGVTAVSVDNTIAALDRIDNQLGVGVATPDHVFYVCPAVCCPADEPDNPGQVYPYPPVNADVDCDGSGVFAVVVDTGFIPTLVNARHPWLTGVTGNVETYNASDITRYTGHGTFVAGVLRCMAPRTKVVVKGFLTHGGAVYEDEIIKKLNLALGLAPDIISMSAGTTTRYNLPSLGFEVLWERRLRFLKGTVLVAAAGNDASRDPFWPAAFPWAVSVGALDMSGGRAGYSNYGSWVDVYALGSDVINAFPNGDYHYQEPPRVGQQTIFNREMALWSGTSFATPLVSGLIAGRVSRTGESGRQAASALLRTARHKSRRGVGPVLEPGDGCRVERRCGCGQGPCSCRGAGRNC
jgi:subtilisin family serine protease